MGAFESSRDFIAFVDRDRCEDVAVVRFVSPLPVVPGADVHDLLLAKVRPGVNVPGLLFEKVVLPVRGTAERISAGGRSGTDALEDGSAVLEPPVREISLRLQAGVARGGCLCWAGEHSRR